MAVSYLDVPGIRARTLMPNVEFDLLDPAFVTSRLAIGTSEINGLLRKRYQTPFDVNTPEVVLGWLTDIVTPELYRRRGWDPEEDDSKDIIASGERARAQMQLAADSQAGLWELPLRNDETSSGVSKGTPLWSSDASPYSWIDAQAEIIRGGGT